MAKIESLTIKIDASEAIDYGNWFSQALREKSEEQINAHLGALCVDGELRDPLFVVHLEGIGPEGMVMVVRPSANLLAAIDLLEFGGVA
jgi:hypothetical protein